MLVGNNDESIYTLTQFLDSLLGKAKLLFAFESEWCGNYCNRQGIAALGDFGNYCSGTCSCSASHTCRNEDHISVLKLFLDFLFAFLGSLLTYFRLTTGTKTACKLLTYGDSGLGIGALQCLDISIQSNKGYFLQAIGDHSVNSISATTTDAYDFDDCRCGLFSCSSIFNIKQIKAHLSSLK